MVGKKNQIILLSFEIFSKHCCTFRICQLMFVNGLFKVATSSPAQSCQKHVYTLLKVGLGVYIHFKLHFCRHIHLNIWTEFCPLGVEPHSSPTCIFFCCYFHITVASDTKQIMTILWRPAPCPALCALIVVAHTPHTSCFPEKSQENKKIQAENSKYSWHHFHH